jgi:hypothetical protein
MAIRSRLIRDDYPRKKSECMKCKMIICVCTKKKKKQLPICNEIVVGDCPGAEVCTIKEALSDCEYNSNIRTIRLTPSHTPYEMVNTYQNFNYPIFLTSVSPETTAITGCVSTMGNLNFNNLTMHNFVWSAGTPSLYNDLSCKKSTVRNVIMQGSTRFVSAGYGLRIYSSEINVAISTGHTFLRSSCSEDSVEYSTGNIRQCPDTTRAIEHGLPMFHIDRELTLNHNNLDFITTSKGLMFGMRPNTTIEHNNNHYNHAEGSGLYHAPVWSKEERECVDVWQGVQATIRSDHNSYLWHGLEVAQSTQSAANGTYFHAGITNIEMRNDSLGMYAFNHPDVFQPASSFGTWKFLSTVAQFTSPGHFISMNLNGGSRLSVAMSSSHLESFSGESDVAIYRIREAQPHTNNLAQLLVNSTGTFAHRGGVRTNTVESTIPSTRLAYGSTPESIGGFFVGQSSPGITPEPVSIGLITP